MPFWKSIYLLLHRKPNDNPFPLNELPDVARIHIIRLMDAHDQVNLALSSKRMEQYIKFTKIRYYDYCHIRIGEEDFTINLNHSLVSYQFQRYKETLKLIGKEMKPWLNEDSSVAENAVTVLKRLQSTFPCKETGVVVPGKDPTVIEMILNSLDNFVFVALINANPEAEDVDAVMQSFKKGREIAIYASEMPLDYSHPNAFKFEIIYYYDARWVRLEHLMTMKDIRSVELERTNLKCEDLNSFLKYWTASDERMTYGLRIGITQETNIQEKTLFDDIFHLEAAKKDSISVSEVLNEYFGLFAMNEHKSERKLSKFDDPTDFSMDSIIFAHLLSLVALEFSRR